MAMDDNAISRTSGKYYKYSLWLVAGTALLALLATNIYGKASLARPLAICTIYTLVVNIAYGAAWKSVAKSSPATLTKFYLAAPALRMMAALMVVVAFCLLSSDKTSIRDFILMFFGFYVVMLVFDGMFFARVEKKNNLKE